MHLDVNGKPVWKDGDVIKIRFVRKRDANPADGLMLSDVYEYVRESGFWPGEGMWWSDKHDLDMTAAWEEGRLAVMEMVDPPEPEPPFVERLRAFVFASIRQARTENQRFTSFDVMVLTREQRDQLTVDAAFGEWIDLVDGSSPRWRGIGVMTAPEDAVLGFPDNFIDCRSV